MKKYLKYIIALTLISLFIYISRDSVKLIIDEIIKTPIKIVIIISITAFFYFLFDGLIITIVARQYKKSFSLLKGILCSYYCAFFRLFTFGSGTGVAEIYYMTKNNIPAAVSTGMSLSKYIIQKIAIAFYGMMGFIIFNSELSDILGKYKNYIFTGNIIAFLIVLGLILISTNKSFAKLIIRIITLLKLKKREYLIEQIDLLQKESKILLHHKRILITAFISNLLKLSAFHIIPLLILGVPDGYSYGSMIALMALVYMLAGVIPAPSGIGSIEFVFVLFFGIIFTNTTALSTVLIYRFATAILPFGIGGIYYLITQKKDAVNL